MGRSYSFEPMKAQQPMLSAQGSGARLGNDEDKQAVAQQDAGVALAQDGAPTFRQANAETVQRYQERAAARGRQEAAKKRAAAKKRKATAKKSAAKKPAAKKPAAKKPAAKKATPSKKAKGARSASKAKTARSSAKPRKPAAKRTGTGAKARTAKKRR